jgi:hypothetical protein
MLVRPAAFGANPETAASNRFQSAAIADAGVREAVDHEFTQMAALLAADLTVYVFDDLPYPPRPDAVFPNNWVSFHADGTVVLYPMLAPNRRLERRPELLDQLVAMGGYRVRRVVDLSHHEAAGRFLEGTGSLVLDRVHRVAYACRSARTDAAVLAEFAAQLEYEPLLFDALSPDRTPIYHTNVMLSVGDTAAVICADAIADERQRRAVIKRLEATGHEVIAITLPQMLEFAGNMLALRAHDGRRLLEMSWRAHESLTAAQRARLQHHFDVLTAHPVHTIERLGGGSVRCMLAEVFLPRA